jgi:hypothetical protein
MMVMMPSLKAFGAGGMRWIQLCCDMGLVCWREIDAGFYAMAFVFSQNPSTDTAQHEGVFFFGDSKNFTNFFN